MRWLAAMMVEAARFRRNEERATEGRFRM